MGWFSPKCPVNEEEQRWIEENFAWFLEDLGKETFEDVEIILPLQEYFPDLYQGRKEDVKALLNRVCDYMDVENDRIDLEFYNEGEQSFAHGLLRTESNKNTAAGFFLDKYHRYTIGIEIGQLKDPMSLVATISHELGHVILLGEDRISPEDDDHEPLTDLITVFYGMGIFTANSSFTFSQYRNQFSQGWQAKRLGYLSEEMFGYALALFSFLKNNKDISWSSYLSTNVKSYFKNSRKYIEKNEKNILEPFRNILNA